MLLTPFCFAEPVNYRVLLISLPCQYSSSLQHSLSSHHHCLCPGCQHLSPELKPSIALPPSDLRLLKVHPLEQSPTHTKSNFVTLDLKSINGVPSSTLQTLPSLQGSHALTPAYFHHLVPPPLPQILCSSNTKLLTLLCTHTGPMCDFSPAFLVNSFPKDSSI